MLKNCLHIAIFNHSKKLPNIFKTGLKIRGVIIKKIPLRAKKYFKLKIIGFN